MRKPSGHSSKMVDWDVKNQIKQKKKHMRDSFILMLHFLSIFFLILAFVDIFVDIICPILARNRFTFNTYTYIDKTLNRIKPQDARLSKIFHAQLTRV